MTQENKEILLKDLCARLPYGVKCVSGVDDAVLIIEGINPPCCGASEIQVTYEKSGINFDTTLSAIKPYLFPISSMTAEQKRECARLLAHTSNIDMIQITGESTYDWFNKNMFDWRGLIPKELAIDATDKNIY